MSKVLLTLAAIDTFKRRDFTVNYVPIVVKKGQTIAVSEDVADQLLDEDNVVRDADHEGHPYFVVAKDGAKVDYDFTVPAVVSEAEPKGERTTTHDLSVLPKTEILSAEHVANQTGKSVRTRQRAKA